MDEEDIKEWTKVGRKTKKVKEKIFDIVEEEITYNELYDKILKLFEKEGLDLAFPINISKNEVAAHDTSDINDERTINKGDVIKIDIGGMINGYISDTAVTIEVSSNKYEKLIETCRKALNEALSKIKYGIKLREIGKIVEKVVKKAGFNPIYNLGGHNMDKYCLHGGIFVPNFDNGDNKVLEEGVYAIEVFITTGKGFTIERGYPKIFSLQKAKTRNVLIQKIVKKIWDERRNLPFDVKYLYKKLGKDPSSIINMMLREKLITTYPPLVEISKGIVAQFEETIIVTKEGIIITTSDEISD